MQELNLKPFDLGFMIGDLGFMIGFKWGEIAIIKNFKVVEFDHFKDIEIDAIKINRI